MNETLEVAKHFTDARRRQARIAKLESARQSIAPEWRLEADAISNAIQAFTRLKEMLAAHVSGLEPLLVADLDDVFALAAHPSHPLRSMVDAAAIKVGFSLEETQWLFSELEVVAYRPFQTLLVNGVTDLELMISAAHSGDSGLLVAGFLRFGGEVELDERVRELVTRFRQQGVTPSVFLVLAVVVVAHAVLGHHELAPSKK